MLFHLFVLSRRLGNCLTCSRGGGKAGTKALQEVTDDISKATVGVQTKTGSDSDE